MNINYSDDYEISSPRGRVHININIIILRTTSVFSLSLGLSPSLILLSIVNQFLDEGNGNFISVCDALHFRSDFR